MAEKMDEKRRKERGIEKLDRWKNRKEREKD
jgi:hypothetical protein